jgi:predicted DNA-binding transcriptional regulator AlpA
MHQLQLTSPTKKATHQGSLICVLCKTTNTLNTLILLLGRAIVQSTKAFMQKIESGVVPGALRIFKAPQAAEALGLKHSTFLNQVKKGIFPRPIYLSPRRPVWRESDLAAFIQAL